MVVGVDAVVRAGRSKVVLFCAQPLLRAMERNKLRRSSVVLRARAEALSALCLPSFGPEDCLGEKVARECHFFWKGNAVSRSCIRRIAMQTY